MPQDVLQLRVASPMDRHVDRPQTGRTERSTAASATASVISLTRSMVGEGRCLTAAQRLDLQALTGQMIAETAAAEPSGPGYQDGIFFIGNRFALPV